MSLEAFYALPEDEQDLWIHRHTNRCHHCGRDRSVCGDPQRPWYPQRQVCYPTMTAEAARRKYERIHKDAQFHNGFTEWSKTASDETPYRYDDGVTIYAAPVDEHPDDQFLTPPDALWDDEDDEAPSAGSGPDQRDRE